MSTMSVSRPTPSPTGSASGRRSSVLYSSVVSPPSNKKKHRLVDMSMSPEEATPYPDPDESADTIEDSIDMAEFGTILHVREWRGNDGIVEQFALMLNVTPAHTAYRRCQELKGDIANFAQVIRTDTWHSTVHSHQYFIDCEYCERQVHEELAGGQPGEPSRRVVNRTFQKLL